MAMDFIEQLENEIEALLCGIGMHVVVFEDYDGYLARFTMPGEYLITYHVSCDDEVVVRLTDAASSIVRFNGMYMDGALHHEIGECFQSLPGVFSFMTQDMDVRAWRMIGILMHGIYGRHNVYAIHVHGENIRVDTRGGRFYFKYEGFNISVKKEMLLMDRCMKKPLRKRFKL